MGSLDAPRLPPPQEAYPENVDVGGVPARVAPFEPAGHGVLQLIYHSCLARQKTKPFILLCL